MKKSALYGNIKVLPSNGKEVKHFSVFILFYSSCHLFKRTVNKELSLLQKNALCGLLLGDASLQTFNGGKTWRLRFLQSEAHKEYLFSLYSLWENFCGTGPTRSVDGNSIRWSFNTLTSTVFNDYAREFYTKNSAGVFVKKVPGLILEDWLTPTGLAYWYSDDGALKWKNRSNAVRLCTDSYSYEDVLCFLVV